jgi:hypothetical protein
MTATSPRTIVCPRYECIHNYIRLIKRPLTGLEQRAFLYLLDLDENDAFEHADDLSGACICMTILPEIVAALSPDPVGATVSVRSLDDQIYKSQRYHTERVGKHQGIVLAPKTQREHTSDLRKLVRKQLKDLDIVVRELLNRPRPEYSSDRAMIEGEMPLLLELARLTLRKRAARTPVMTWANLRANLDAKHSRETVQLKQLQCSLTAWGVA